MGDELGLERGAVALCPLATGRAQLLSNALVPEEGVRPNEECLNERSRRGPVAASARGSVEVRLDICACVEAPASCLLGRIAFLVGMKK